MGQARDEDRLALASAELSDKAAPCPAVLNAVRVLVVAGTERAQALLSKTAAERRRCGSREAADALRRLERAKAQAGAPGHPGTSASTSNPASNTTSTPPSTSAAALAPVPASAAATASKSAHKTGKKTAKRRRKAKAKTAHGAAPASKAAQPSAAGAKSAEPAAPAAKPPPPQTPATAAR